MLRKENIKDKRLKRIYAGEIYITKEKGIIITTLLGSCVSVCLSDNINSVFGINHFMLPEKGFKGRQENIYKYAEPAISNLIELMLKQGAELNTLEAKVFGGALVAKTGFSIIPEMNIKITLKSLSKYGIKIKARDIGGIQGRQIYFCTGDRIYAKKIRVSNL